MYKNVHKLVNIKAADVTETLWATVRNSSGPDKRFLNPWCTTIIMILEKRYTFMLHLPTSSVEVLFKKKNVHNKTFNLVESPVIHVRSSQVASRQKKRRLESPARTSPSVWWSLLIGHSRTRFLWVWVYLQLFLTFSCKRTTTRCVCWQQHTRSNGDFCRLANRNNRLWHLSPSAWSSDALTTAAPVDLSLSPPPGLTLALLASAPLCRPLLTGLSLYGLTVC